MKKIYEALTILTGLALPNIFFGQCASTANLGTASNLFTKVINSNSAISANKDLNTVVFIHRNNATLNGGSSGQLRYDYSTNGGSSWTIDQGVLNPLGTSLARYPNIAIYNPPLNTVPSNAYVSYMGATINNAAAWNGNVTGVRQLNNAGNTESYNQPAGPSAYIPRSLVKGAPGVFWALDAQWGANLTGFNVYKGTWSNAINDIVWATNFSVSPPFNLGYANFAFTGIDYNIAFDPTGMIGWFSFLGHVSPGPANYAYYPVFYKTTDGGVNWSGPITADLNTMSCLTSNLPTGRPSTNLEHDLVVDVYGNPHLITTIVDGNNTYSSNYNAWHHMYDITCVNGIWTGYDLGNVNGSPYTWGVSPNFVTQYQAPQAARTADGTKVFFTWVDNSSYSLGAVNNAPNLFGKAFDVVTKQWTNVKDFTSCNAPIAGNIIFPHIADEVLQPNGTTFKLASCYGQVTAGDPGQVSNFLFLDNITFTTSEFSTPQPSLNVSIAQGSMALACINGSANVNVTGNYDAILWSNGSTVAINPLSTPGIYTVTAMTGCAVGSKTINVSVVSANIAYPNGQGVCNGSAVTLTVSGAATGYTWLPSNTGGSTVTIVPTTNSTFSIQVFGDGCSDIIPIPVTIMPLPTLTVIGTTTVCLGSSVSQTITGGVNYGLIGGSIPSTLQTVANLSGVIIINTPTANLTYTVFGVNANFCIDSVRVNLSVIAGPTISASATKTLICSGQTTSLIVTAGDTYTLTSPSTTTVLNVPSSAVSPTSTSTYTFTSENAVGCKGDAEITITVSDCTGIETISSSNSSGLSIYPNPNNGEFTLSTGAEMQLTIINELGQVVKTVSLDKANDYKVSINGLAKGIYFITGRSGDNVLNQKIVIGE